MPGAPYRSVFPLFQHGMNTPLYEYPRIEGWGVASGTDRMSKTQYNERDATAATRRANIWLISLEGGRGRGPKRPLHANIIEKLKK